MKYTFEVRSHAAQGDIVKVQTVEADNLEDAANKVHWQGGGKDPQKHGHSTKLEKLDTNGIVDIWRGFLPFYGQVDFQLISTEE